MPERSAEPVVLDASAAVEALIGTPLGSAVRARMRGCELHAPAHLDAGVLSALGRLRRGGDLTEKSVRTALSELARAPITRHHLAGLLAGAWAARKRLRLVDALYVELTNSLGATLLTADARLAGQCATADLVSQTSPR